jgi:hypothetical protein
MIVAALLLMAATHVRVCVTLLSWDEGKGNLPLPGMEVGFEVSPGQTRMATTDPQGRACFDGLYPGVTGYFVVDGRAFADDMKIDYCVPSQDDSVRIVLPGPPSSLIIDCTYLPGVSFDLNSVVHDREGSPVRGANVLLFEVHKKRWWTSKTDRHGRFRFKNIPFGLYDVTFQKDGLLPRTVRINERICGSYSSFDVEMFSPCK